MKFIVVSLFIASLSLLNASEERLALIIGNNAYQNAKVLDNPINDTKLIAQTLKNLNFNVTLLQDATNHEIKNALKTFQQKLSKNSIGLFYFAGHGVESRGKNYLIPIDAPSFENYSELKNTTLQLDSVVSIFNSIHNDMNIIILDACREYVSNNILSAGLAAFTQPSGLFVAYSAQAGSLANDGPKNGLSPFAEAFTNQLHKPGLDIETLFKEIRKEVYLKTNGEQRPTTYSEILKTFVFHPDSKNTRALKKQKLSPSENSIEFKYHKRYIEPQLVRFEAGEFTQGNNDEWESSPAHKVKIEKPFYISTHEITFEEYDLFCEDTNWKKPSDENWGRGKQPVINITWDDAQEYAQWLSQKTKHYYRLPTEAEWEYVARLSGDSVYGMAVNEAVLQTYAWFEDSLEEQHTHEVGSKKPDPNGMYDMFGNVAEWISDSFYTYDSAAYHQKKTNGQEKVVRGGSWKSSYDELQLYKRSAIDKYERSNHIGFRLVKEI